MKITIPEPTDLKCTVCKIELEKDMDILYVFYQKETRCLCDVCSKRMDYMLQERLLNV